MSIISISLLLSIFAYALSVWLGRKNPVRASSLTAGMILLLLLCPLFILLPKWSIEVSWLQSGDSTAQTQEQAQLGSTIVLASAWGIGALLFIARYLQQLAVLRRWKKEAHIPSQQRITQTLEKSASLQELEELPQIRLSEYLSSPVVIGLIHPIILLPKNALKWDSTTLEMVLSHELRHIKRKDLWLTHASQIVCVLYWFNPLVWLLKKRLRHQCEFAVDAEVISKGVDAKSYIHALCNVAESMLQQKMPSAALGMADRASLRNRVDNLLSKRSSNAPYLIGSILSLSFTCALALAMVKPISPVLDQANTLESAQADYSEQEIQTRLTASPFPLDN